MSAIDIQSSVEEELIKMPKRLKNDFLKLLAIQSHGKNEHHMVVYIIDKLRRMGLTPEIDHVGNIIVQKGQGEFLPCIVGHMDTVHSFEEDFRVQIRLKKTREIAYAVSKGENKAGEEIVIKAGIGGDDKNGIFACFYLLQKFDNIKAIFFTQEESGCVGSNKIKTKYFENVGYLLQLDRWGRDDFISQGFNGSMTSDDFDKATDSTKKKFKYTDTSGLSTDVVTLFGRGIGVSCANISCGYYAHHSYSEYIDLNEFYNSLLFTEELIKVLGEKKYSCDPVPYRRRYRNHYNDYDDYDDYYYGVGYGRQRHKTIKSKKSKNKKVKSGSSNYYKKTDSKDNEENKSTASNNKTNANNSTQEKTKFLKEIHAGENINVEDLKLEDKQFFDFLIDEACRFTNKSLVDLAFNYTPGDREDFLLYFNETYAYKATLEEYKHALLFMLVQF